MKPATPSPAIVIDGLTKRYRGQTEPAVSDLTLTVNRGEVYGFLGPNGAGKSTTIRLLLNFIRPTGGTAAIVGNDSVKDSVAARRHIGYVAGDFAGYGKMTGRQFLQYMADLQPTRRAGCLAELLRTLQADPKPPLATLSKGNRQKFGIIQAFMHEPDILILDEPTSGLDPLMQEVFYGLVRRAKARGASVFVSSHNLAEVRKMCDRVGFIRAGRLVSENSIAELTAAAAHLYTVTFQGKPPRAALKKVAGVSLVEAGPDTATVRVTGELAPLFAELAKHPVSAIERREADLEQQFMSFYKAGRK